jgi:hypothetical protein
VYILSAILIMEFCCICVFQEVLAIQLGEVSEASEGHLVQIGIGIHLMTLNMQGTHQCNSLEIMQ